MYHTEDSSARVAVVPPACMRVLCALYDFEARQPLLCNERVPKSGFHALVVDHCVNLGWITSSNEDLGLTERGSAIVELGWSSTSGQDGLRFPELMYLSSLNECLMVED